MFIDTRLQTVAYGDIGDIVILDQIRHQHLKLVTNIFDLPCRHQHPCSLDTIMVSLKIF